MQFYDIVAYLGAIAALGAAACGLVDATKIFGGGVSRAGFKYIEVALKPFRGGLESTLGHHWRDVFHGPWINGMDEVQQIERAKKIVRMGLTATNDGAVAKYCGVDLAALNLCIASLLSGAALTPDEQCTLDRFDDFLHVRLDAAYERADQRYRNASKLLAGAFAVILAIIGGRILYAAQNTDAGSHYFGSRQFAIAIIVGLVAVPLAPVAKDLASQIAAGAKAVEPPKV